MNSDANSILNKVSAMVGYWDRDLRNQYCNEAYANWCGLTPAQILGRHLRDVISEETFQLNLPFIEGALRGEVQRFERSIASTDGKSVRHTLAEYLPDIVGGEVLGFVVNVVDVGQVKSAYAELEGGTRHLKAILDNLFAYVALLDTNGVVLEVNKAPLDQAGFRREDVIGQFFFDAPWWNYRGDVRERIIQSIKRAGQGTTDRFDIVAKMGEEFQTLDFMISAVRDDLGNVISLIPTAIDITYRKRIESDLRIAASAFNSRLGILVTDANANILRANQAFLDTMGYSLDDIVGKNPRLFKSDKYSHDFYVQMWKRINEVGHWEGEIWDRCKDGKLIFRWLDITAVKEDSGAVSNYVSTQTDITARKMAEEAVEHLAFYDSLTDLPNRRLLSDRLQQAKASLARKGKEGAILFIDLDNFKTLNDTQGHDVGDLLLIQVAKRLRANVREGDTVARLGGDEYVVILEDLSDDPIEAASEAKEVGKKILNALNDPYQLVGHEYRSTSSIGVTLLNAENHSIDEMLKHADIAMYQAKKSGRNTLRFFDPKMQEAINTRVSAEKELLNAIEQKQFQLYYQIQVDSEGGVLGAEALIRWIHPARGLVSPAEFIPLAEETGLILPIGSWVVEAACGQLKAWEVRGIARNLALAVNVSAKQVQHEDFVCQMKAIVQKYEVRPCLLKLELTESMLVENVEDTINKIEQLRDFGIRFSLDDFGTGYSSLQYLKKIPINQLKIDQSFIRGIETDHHDQSIVRTVIAIAHSLEIDVIAEGVETDGQLQILKRTGCKAFQGYLFAKPMAVELFEALLQRQVYPSSASDADRDIANPQVRT
jgi:diguanylate cyclase (GGDEF)-like protein/PAS domain S-box-containing protein